MRLRLNEAELKQLNGFLDACSDCERLSAREVVLDLYEIERPVTMNFVFVKGGLGVDGAAYLEYSEEEKGYYMGGRIESADELRTCLEAAGALPVRDANG